jgi:hypothetical protein
MWINSAYDAWMSINPAVREPAKSAAVSLFLGIVNALFVSAGTAFSQGAFASPHSTAAWFATSWWGILVGFVFGGGVSAAYRGRQGFMAATSTVVTSASTSVPNPPPPAKIVAVDVADAPGEPTHQTPVAKP